MAKKNSAVKTGVKVQKSRTDKVFDFFLYLISGIIVILMLYPMYFIVIASFSNPADVSAGNIIFLPKGITFKGYRKLMEYSQLWVGYKNTILYAIVGTAISPMFFTGGLIPTYLIVKDFGLLDNFWVMVLPFSVITYYIIVARTFFQNSIPGDLWEAAQIDGCGNLGFFFQIILPLSKAVLAVIAMWTAVGQWNSYFNALIYLRSPELQPLQLVLRNILISNQTIGSMSTGAAAVEAKQMADLIKYAIIVVSSAPIMCMYPFVQK